MLEVMDIDIFPIKARYASYTHPIKKWLIIGAAIVLSYAAWFVFAASLLAGAKYGWNHG